MVRLWKSYRKYVENTYLGALSWNRYELEYWRAKLFMYIMMFFGPVSIFAYIPGFILAVREKLIVVAVFDTVAMITLFFLLFSTRLGIRAKKTTLIVVLYLLALIMLVYLGAGGPGLIYLLGVSVFTSLIFDSRAGYVSVIINTLIYMAMGVGLITGHIKTEFFEQYTLPSWLAIGANMILINMVTVISVSTILKWLESVITREKKIRGKLREDYILLREAKGKAEESDRLKSAFLANLSHEIRTPMNAILGFTDLLNESPDSEKRLKYTGIIVRSGERLLSLIDELIDLSKIEAGAAPLSMLVTDIQALITGIYNEMQIICPPEITFRIYTDIPESGRRLLTDPGKLTRIMVKLLTNAFKYTVDGVVEIGAIRSPGSQSCNFYVKDTGMGIPADKKDAVFDRFYQMETTPDGVGLGLAICKALTKVLNGKIWFESEEGKGTTFYLNIPCFTPGDGPGKLASHNQGAF